MPGLRPKPTAAHLARLSPRAVHFLRLDGYRLYSKVLWGSPSDLQRTADCLRRCAEELRFRKPLRGFADYLDSLADIADLTRVERQSKKWRALEYTKPGRPHLRLNGAARFSQRGRS